MGTTDILLALVIVAGALWLFWYSAIRNRGHCCGCGDKCGKGDRSCS